MRDVIQFVFIRIFWSTVKTLFSRHLTTGGQFYIRTLIYPQPDLLYEFKSEIVLCTVLHVMYFIDSTLYIVHCTLYIVSHVQIMFRELLDEIISTLIEQEYPINKILYNSYLSTVWDLRLNLSLDQVILAGWQPIDFSFYKLNFIF